MGRREFTIFKKQYLARFRKYYKECTNNKQRKELKNSIFDNNNLTKLQKEEFWNKVLNDELDI